MSSTERVIHRPRESSVDEISQRMSVFRNGNGMEDPADVFAAVSQDTLPALTLPQTLPEKELVDGAKAGDGEAVTALYEIYFPRVYRYMLARTGRVEDSEDLAQGVFIGVMEAIDRFQWRETPFSAWVFRIAHNQVISKRRKDSVRQQRYLSDVVQEAKLGIITLGDNLEDQTYPDIDQKLDDQTDLDRIAQACRYLTDTYREVIYLRFVAGLSVAETAAAMGKGEGNVKVIQHKAIAKLRKFLGVVAAQRKAA